MDTPGVILADDMGLGKTLEALFGALLRRGIARARGQTRLSTVVVAPNDAVMEQVGVRADRSSDCQCVWCEGGDGCAVAVCARMPRLLRRARSTPGIAATPPCGQAAAP